MFAQVKFGNVRKTRSRVASSRPLLLSVVRSAGKRRRANVRSPEGQPAMFRRGVFFARPCVCRQEVLLRRRHTARYSSHKGGLAGRQAPPGGKPDAVGLTWRLFSESQENTTCPAKGTNFFFCFWQCFLILCRHMR